MPLKGLIKQNKKFDFLLQSGWTKDTNHLDQESIYKYLIKNKDSFARIKHLNYGPHKATIDYYLNNQNEQVFSRGEQKKLSMFYWIMQVLMLVELNIKTNCFDRRHFFRARSRENRLNIGLFNQTRGSNLYYRYWEQAFTCG